MSISPITKYLRKARRVNARILSKIHDERWARHFEKHPPIIGPIEYVGAFPIRQDIEVLPADEPKKLKLGWVVNEIVGMTSSNTGERAKITPPKNNNYLILDKNNMPVGESSHYEGVGPIDTAYDYEDDLWMWSRFDAFKSFYDPDEHRVFQATIGTQTLLAGGGNWCDKVHFLREVPKSEVKELGSWR